MKSLSNYRTESSLKLRGFPGHFWKNPYIDSSYLQAAVKVIHEMSVLDQTFKEKKRIFDKCLTGDVLEMFEPTFPDRKFWTIILFGFNY